MRALLIFSLRLLDVSLYTTRMFMVVRGWRKAAWLAAFCQSVTYFTRLVEAIDENAFVTAENVRLVRHGYWRK